MPTVSEVFNHRLYVGETIWESFDHRLYVGETIDESFAHRFHIGVFESFAHRFHVGVFESFSHRFHVGVSKSFNHRLRIPGAFINETFNHRLHVGSILPAQNFLHVVSVGAVRKRFLHRVKVFNSVTKIFQHRLSVYPYADPLDTELYELSQNYNIPPIEVAHHKNLGPLEMTFKVNNTDIGCIPYQFVVNMAESQPTTWTLSIIDPFGSTSPLNVPPSPWSELMNEKAWGLDPNAVGGIGVTKYLNVNVKWGGKDWNFSGVPQSWSHTRDWENRYFSFAWKGTDHSVKFNREAQTMQTVRSTGTAGGAKKASAVLAEILTRYGVEHDLSNIAADDYVIPVMQRQSGNPMEWITQILGVRMHEWHMRNGKTFVSYYPNPEGPPNLIHDFEKMEMLEESYDGSNQAIITKVIVIRAVESGGNQTDGGAVDVFNFGDGYSASFSTPISNGYYNVIHANNGFFCNFVWKKGGVTIATREMISGTIDNPTYSNSGYIIGADSVEFSWHVLPGGFIGVGAPGRIEFHGTPETDDIDSWGEKQVVGGGVPGDPAPWARVFSPDPVNSIGFPGGVPLPVPTETQKKYGIREIELTANPLIPTKTVAQVYADRYLMRVSRQARFATYRIPLNPDITPGMIIREIDKMLQIGYDQILDTYPTSGNHKYRTRVITSCTHSFSKDPAQRYTTLTGTDYSPL